MPVGDPRCPDCHGAGGRMARRVGQRAKWVRCQRCTPNRVNENSRLQAIGALRSCLHLYKTDPTRLANLRIAVSMATHFHSLEELGDELQLDEDTRNLLRKVAAE